MSQSLTAGAAILAFLVFLAVAVGFALLPTVVLGAIISVLFGIGFWQAALYVLGASIALQIVVGSLRALVR